MISCLLTIVGWLVVIKAALYIGRLLYVVYGNKGYDLIDRYGKESWALITGSTDGIGLCFAHEIAKRGFNVIISGRSLEKVNERVKELETAYPKIKAKGIEVDFSKCDQPGFIEEIKKKVEGFDISLLVNNVGTIRYENVGMLLDEHIVYLIKLNCMNQALMLNSFLPQLNMRSKRSGIIDVGSVYSKAVSPSLELQAAVKHYNRALTMSVDVAQRFERVDMLCLMPGWTKTNMLKDLRLSLINAPAEEVASGALRDLGHFTESYGSLRHYLNGLMIEFFSFLLPYPWATKVTILVEKVLRGIETKQ